MAHGDSAKKKDIAPQHATGARPGRGMRPDAKDHAVQKHHTGGTDSNLKLLSNFDEMNAPINTPMITKNCQSNLTFSFA